MNKYFDMKEIDRQYRKLEEDEKVINTDEVRRRIDEIYELSEDLKDLITAQHTEILMKYSVMTKILTKKFMDESENEWRDLCELYKELDDLGNMERWDRMMRITES